MTRNSPRIYVYKITFDEVDHYYYYGVHKEKFFDEYYMGSPVTHKEYWEKYTPRKEYIEFFEYNDEGYAEARKFEDNLIAPVLNEEFCLNEHYGGLYSLEICRKGGKIMGNRNKENKTGIFGRSPEKMSQDAKNAGRIAYEKGTGIHSRSKEKMSEDNKKSGRISSSQKWKCTVTGYISTAAGLTFYQNKRGIDLSNRIKVDGSRSWEITFEDGIVIITTKTLKEWTKENDYSYDALLHVRRGNISNYCGIVKVVAF